MAEVQVGAIAVVMVMPVVVVVVVVVVMAVGMALVRAVAATANRAHQTTSMSLIRISSPADGRILPPPHSGQGASLSAISTSRMQS